MYFKNLKFKIFEIGTSTFWTGCSCSALFILGVYGLIKYGDWVFWLPFDETLFKIFFVYFTYIIYFMGFLFLVQIPSIIFSIILDLLGHSLSTETPNFDDCYDDFCKIIKISHKLDFFCKITDLRKLEANGSFNEVNSNWVDNIKFTVRENKAWLQYNKNEDMISIEINKPYEKNLELGLNKALLDRTKKSI